LEIIVTQKRILGDGNQHWCSLLPTKRTQCLFTFIREKKFHSNPGYLFQKIQTDPNIHFFPF